MMDAPKLYLGIEVPELLAPNWGTIEASYWRMGVRHGLLGGAELIRNSKQLIEFTDDHMGDINAAADCLESKVNP